MPSAVEEKFDKLDFMIRWEAGELDEDEERRLFQELVNNGQAWSLQGTYGRRAAQLLDEGAIHAKGQA